MDSSSASQCPAGAGVPMRVAVGVRRDRQVTRAGAPGVVGDHDAAGQRGGDVSVLQIAGQAFVRAADGVDVHPVRPGADDAAKAARAEGEGCVEHVLQFAIALVFEIPADDRIEIGPFRPALIDLMPHGNHSLLRRKAFFLQKKYF